MSESKIQLKIRIIQAPRLLAKYSLPILPYSKYLVLHLSSKLGNMRASVFPSTLFLLLCGIATAKSSTTPTPDVAPIRQLHEKPCLGEITRPWKNHIIAPLGWNPDSLVTEAITAYEDSILVVDSWHHKDCARFLVIVNSRRVAKTERSSVSSDDGCKDCTKTGEYMEAYITLPKGKLQKSSFGRVSRSINAVNTCSHG